MLSKLFENYYNTYIAIWSTQWIKFENLPAAPTQSGLNTSVTTSLWNIADIIILFPRIGYDYMIYKNIMYENIILKVGNRNIPNFPLTTIGAIFLGMMYSTSDFADFEMGMTAEFEDSLTRPRNEMRIIEGNFTRINMSTDCTSFLLNIQCERQGGVTYFDGFLRLMLLLIEAELLCLEVKMILTLYQILMITLLPSYPLICFVKDF
jgi:hypothetical protein